MTSTHANADPYLAAAGTLRMPFADSYEQMKRLTIGEPLQLGPFVIPDHCLSD